MWRGRASASAYFLPFSSGAADDLRNRHVPTLGHTRDAPATATDPTAIQSVSERGTRAPNSTIRGSPAPAPNSRHLHGESPHRIAINHPRTSQHGCRIKRTQGLEEMP